MCDLFGLFLLIRHLGKLAEQKGQPRSSIVIPTVLLYLGFEIGGAILGYQVFGHTTGAFMLGLVGIVIGVLLSSFYVKSLPYIARSYQDEGRVGPSTEGPQLVGASCVVCARKIVSAVNARACPVCNQPCHDDCQPGHVHELASAR